MSFMVDNGKDDRKSSYYDARFEKPSKSSSVAGSRDGSTSRPRSAIENWRARMNDVGIQGSGRDSAGRMRFSNLPKYDHDQASSSHQSGYDPSYMKRTNVGHYVDKNNRVEYMHPDEKDELLKKIDELKDQIIRSCDITENPRQNNRMMPSPMHMSSSPSRNSHYSGHGYYPPNVSNSPQRHLPQAYYADYNRRPPPSTHNFNGTSPLVREHGRRNFDRDYVNERKVFHHELDCSCLKCYVDNWQIPSRNPQAVTMNKRSANDSTRGQSKRVCMPIAGGAPFILCTNCFELLKLPQRAIKKGRTEHQVRCGNCSSINMMGVDKNGLAPIPTATDQASTEVGESSETNSLQYNHVKHDTKESCSLDFDNSSCNFQTDTESSNIISVDEKHDEYGSSSSSHLVVHQKTDTTEDGLNTASDDIASKSGEENLKESYSQDEVKVIEDLKGNGYVETELDVSLNHEEDVSMATEIDDSFVDYSIVSDIGFDKKGQTESPDSNQSVEVQPNVFVNGKPLADHIVKKAEELAGPILPGNYWYDFQAGFWGVIGHPCLGIIPPFIDQFSSPMSERCSNGNTGIHVNGRELHDRDLDLLANRGLPTTPNKYYVVLFSGRVFDKYSGEELTGLGKLAPTVDRQKRGFGLQVPRFIQN